jgi:hypothetical protein
MFLPLQLSINRIKVSKNLSAVLTAVAAAVPAQPASVQIRSPFTASSDMMFISNAFE